MCSDLSVLASHVRPGCVLGVMDVPQSTPHQAVALEATAKAHLHSHPSHEEARFTTPLSQSHDSG